MSTEETSSRPNGEWDSETLIEGRYDAERMMRRFEEANGSIRGNE